MLVIIMAQYSPKSGIKIFGIKRGESVTDKLSQLHDMKISYRGTQNNYKGRTNQVNHSFGVTKGEA